MSYFENVSKLKPCPICGKPDWCTLQHTDNNEVLNYCRRILDGCNVISPIDGQVYTFISYRKDNSAMYENEEMREAATDEWKKKNHISKQNLAPKQPRCPMVSSNPLPFTKGIEPLSNKALDTIYRSFLNKLILYTVHLNYLKKEGWSSKLIAKSLFRSLPSDLSLREKISKELINEFGSLLGVPGFYKGRNDKWTCSGPSGILIPIYDYSGYMYRLRIRRDHPELDENGKEKNKYNNFSSYYEKKLDNGIIINAFKDGCRSGNHIGVYTNPITDDYTVAYLTEGEKKSIFTNDTLKNPVISIPGVNSYHKLSETFENGYNVLDYLQAKGCKILIVAYDADKLVNKAVLMHERRLVEFLLKNYEFNVAIASWNPGFGKGLDDILTIGVRPNYEIISLDELSTQVP